MIDQLILPFLAGLDREQSLHYFLTVSPSAVIIIIERGQLSQAILNKPVNKLTSFQRLSAWKVLRLKLLSGLSPLEH